MSGGYTTQWVPWPFPVGHEPLEGEPIWDAENRRVGFWNFQYKEVNWFRLPKHGEAENYIPEHEVVGNKIRFREPSHVWGAWLELNPGNITDIVRATSEEYPTHTVLLITVTDVNNVVSTYTVDLGNIMGPPGITPQISFEVDVNGNLIATTTT